MIFQAVSKTGQATVDLILTLLQTAFADEDGVVFSVPLCAAFGQDWISLGVAAADVAMPARQEDIGRDKFSFDRRVVGHGSLLEM